MTQSFIKAVQYSVLPRRTWVLRAELSVQEIMKKRNKAKGSVWFNLVGTRGLLKQWTFSKRLTAILFNTIFILILSFCH